MYFGKEGGGKMLTKDDWNELVNLASLLKEAGSKEQASELIPLLDRITQKVYKIEALSD